MVEFVDNIPAQRGRLAVADPPLGADVVLAGAEPSWSVSRSGPAIVVLLSQEDANTLQRALDETVEESPTFSAEELQFLTDLSLHIDANY